MSKYLLSVSMLLILVSCQSQHGLLVGQWIYEDKASMVTYTYDASGEFFCEIKLKGESKPEGEMQGNWTLEDSDLSTEIIMDSPNQKGKKIRNTVKCEIVSIDQDKMIIRLPDKSEQTLIRAGSKAQTPPLEEPEDDDSPQGN